MAASQAYVLDTTARIVSSVNASTANGSYKAGDVVSIQVNFNDTVAIINENSGTGQTIYTATSTDTGDITAGATTYSLKAATGDVSLFSINATTGAVTLTGNPNFEAKSSYAFTVVATDAANNASERAITLAINNLDEVAPAITSGAVATSIYENSGAPQATTP